jgi:hypothetical protein
MEPQIPAIPTPPAPVAPPIPPVFAKKNNAVVILLSALLLVAISVATFFYFQTQKLANQLTQLQTSVSSSPSPTATSDVTVSWKTYEDKKWKFSLKYPQEFFTACNYSDSKGLMLWGPNFGCPEGHDIFYTISATGYEEKDYKPYKKASKSEKIILAGKNATKNTYVFDESDGPLYGLHEETEIIVPLQSGLIQIVLLGQDAKSRVFFDQILSTFKFTN